MAAENMKPFATMSGQELADLVHQLTKLLEQILPRDALTVLVIGAPESGRHLLLSKLGCTTTLALLEVVMRELQREQLESN
jgi:hypothetical protein